MYKEQIKLNELENKIKKLEGIHCVIGDRYCSYKEEEYLDEFYIDVVSEKEIQIFYNKETYKYETFEEMIESPIFEGKTIKELIDKIFFE